MNVVLLCLLMDPGHKQNPALNTTLRSRFSGLCVLNPVVVTVLVTFASILETTSLSASSLVLKIFKIRILNGQ